MTDRTRNARARRHRSRRRAKKMVIRVVVSLDFYEAACWSGWITREDMADAEVLAERLGRVIDYLLGVEEPSEVTRYQFQDSDMV